MAVLLFQAQFRFSTLLPGGLKILILNGSGLQIQTSGAESKIRWVGIQTNRSRTSAGSGGLSIMPKTLDVPLCTTPTTSTLPQKTSHCFIVIDGKLSFFSSGSSSISVSSVSGVTARMPCVYRFTSPLSPTVLLPLLSTTSSWADLSSKLCAYWAAPCWLRMTSWNFSDSGRTIWTIVDKWN